MTATHQYISELVVDISLAQLATCDNRLLGTKLYEFNFDLLNVKWSNDKEKELCDYNCNTPYLLLLLAVTKVQKYIFLLNHHTKDNNFSLQYTLVRWLVEAAFF